MNKDELKKQVWEIIDNNCDELSQQDFLEFLQEFRDEINIHAEKIYLDIIDEESKRFE